MRIFILDFHYLNHDLIILRLLLLVFLFCFGVRNKNGCVLSKKVSPKLQRKQNKEEMKRTSPVLYVYIIHTDICLRPLLEIEWMCHYLEKMIRQNKIKRKKTSCFPRRMRQRKEDGRSKRCGGGAVREAEGPCLPSGPWRGVGQLWYDNSVYMSYKIIATFQNNISLLSFHQLQLLLWTLFFNWVTLYQLPSNIVVNFIILITETAAYYICE